MSAILYDEALVKKLQSWIKDESLKITAPNETKRLFQYVADSTNDKPIKLPLITLRRDPTLTILHTNKRPLSHDGWRNKSVAYDNEDNYYGKTAQLNAIPMQLNYQIDIYTRYEAEAEEYIRNFVFNIINFPKIQIIIPYNDSNIPHNSNIRLLPDIINNSDIPERLIPGQFTRYTININIDDAYLFNYRVKDNWRVDQDTAVIPHLDIDLKTSLDVKREE